MTEKLKKIATFMLCISQLMGMSFARAEEKTADSPTAEFQRFFYALKLIRQHYVDGDKVSYKNLFDMALRGLLKELDPYSAYETEKDFNATKSNVRGERAGIGVSVTSKLGCLEICGIDRGGPAEKAELKPGDLIQEINGESVSDRKTQEAVELLRGPAGESLTLKIYRPSTDKHMEILVTRETLRVHSVTGAKIINKTNGTAYLRITQFGNNTAKELDKALKELDEQGMKMLIIDLRGNPGGLVATAASVCSRFLPPEKKIVSLRARNEKEVKVFFTKKCAVNRQTLPLVILVNGSTASAAEIMTACLRDYKRAVIIGEQTFGKGAVQNLIPFGEKEALRITTAHYYTPSNQVIQGKGITPDISVTLTPARRFALANQINRFPGEVMPLFRNAVRDIQLERATEVLKAVKLYHDAHQTEQITKTKNIESSTR